MIERAVGLFDTLLGEKVSEGLTEFKNRKDMKKKLKKYSERYFKETFNRFDNQQKEFDLVAVDEYLIEHIEDRLLPCLISANELDKEKFRLRLLNEIFTRNKIVNEEAKKEVCAYISVVIALITEFFYEKADNLELFLVSLTIEQVKENTKKQLQEFYTNLENKLDYKGSFAEKINSIQLEKKNNRPMHYLNNTIGFHGRNKEMENLERLLSLKDKLSLTFITGRGGVGKSKLLRNFIDCYKLLSSWKFVMLDAAKVQEFLVYSNFEYEQDLFIVLDYVGVYADKIGELVEKINSSPSRSNRIRLVLLERQGIAVNQANETIIYPDWYHKLLGKAPRRRRIEELILPFNVADPKIASMTSLNEEAIYSIIDDYSLNFKKGKISKDDKEKILEYTREIEKNNQDVRPLIVLFVTDAFLTNESYHQWNIEQLIENYLDKLKSTWENLCINQTETCEALTKMIVYATAIRSWQLEEMEGILQEPSAELINLSRSDLDRLVASVNEETEFSDSLNGVEPDLIGEYFVLEFLKENIRNKKFIKSLIQLFWQSPEHFTSFMMRAIEDYSDREIFSELFKDRLALFEPESDDREQWYYYMLFLLQMIFVNPLLTESVVGKIEDISGRHSNDYIFVNFLSIGYVNLSAEQELLEREETVFKLGELQRKYPKSEELAVTLGRGYVNLTLKQELPEREETVLKLAELQIKYPKSEELMVGLSKGYVNLTTKQELLEREETVFKLLQLHINYPDSEELAVELGKGYVNLSNKQEIREREGTVLKLVELQRKYPKSEELAVTLGKGYVNLTLKQELREREETVLKLAELQIKYPKSEELVVWLSKGYVNLSAKQELLEREETVFKLLQLHINYPNSEELAVELGKGYANLSNKQEIREREGTVLKLVELQTKYPKSEELAVTLGKGYVNLTLKQELPEREETVLKLAELQIKYPKSEELVVGLSQGYVNLSAKQELLEREETVLKLVELQTKYPNSEELAVELGKGYVNLSNKQEIPEREGTVLKLVELQTKYPKSEVLAVRLGRGYVNLTLKQELPEREETVLKLVELQTKYPKSEELVVWLSKGYVNLTLKQELLEREETVFKLLQLHINYPNSEELAVELGKGYANLSNKQDLSEREGTVLKLVELQTKYPKSEELAVILGIGYVSITTKQELPEREETVLKLAELQIKYRKSEELAVILGEGYVMLNEERKIE